VWLYIKFCRVTSSLSIQLPWLARAHHVPAQMEFSNGVPTVSLSLSQVWDRANKTSKNVNKLVTL
jgi:hypothetical protein